MDLPAALPGASSITSYHDGMAFPWFLSMLDRITTGRCQYIELRVQSWLCHAVGDCRRSPGVPNLVTAAPPLEQPG